MTTTIRRARARSARDEGTDQRVHLSGVSWERYAALVRALGDAAGVRTTYLDGELEIMSPSDRHEHRKKLIARLVEAFADAREVPLLGLGSTTYRKKAKAAGLEPDECYFLETVKPAPDLAIEIVLSSGGTVDRLEAFARLGVREVWLYRARDERLLVHRLGSDGRTWKLAKRSRVLPGLDPALVERLVAGSKPEDQPRLVKELRRAIGG